MAFVETANLKTKDKKGSFLGDMLSVVGPMALGALGSIASGGMSQIGGGLVSSILGGGNESTKAMGGNIPQMTKYASGGSHEQNGLGGIPVDSLGNPSGNPSALVEQGEVGYKLPNDKSGYVFSNRIKYPGSKHTFADEAKKITSKYKNRLGKDLNKPDTLAKQAMDMAMEELKNKQELIKNEEALTAQVKAYGSYIKANGGYLKKLPKGGDIENFLKGAGYKEAMLGYGIQGLTRLPQLFTSPESISYDRVNPELVDFAQERGSMETSRNAQLGFLKRQAGMAGNAGQALNYLASAVPSAYNQYDQQYAQSIEREQNTNAQIMNQANAQNAQIQMKEAEANAMERDAARGIRDQALGDIGNIGLSAMMTKPNMMNQYNTLKAQGLIGDYDISWNADGSPKITRKGGNTSVTNPATMFNPTNPLPYELNNFAESSTVAPSNNDYMTALGLNNLPIAMQPILPKSVSMQNNNTPQTMQKRLLPMTSEYMPVYNETPNLEFKTQEELLGWYDKMQPKACGGSLKKCKGGYLKKKGKK